MGRNLRELNWNNKPTVDPGEFEPIPAGGYVCKILNAEFAKSKAGNEMLVLNVDVAEGDFAGYFIATVNRFNQDKWPNHATYRQLLLDKQGDVDSRFKGLFRILEQSNPGFVANIDDFDEKVLYGKLCGFVFADEEYPKQDGSTGVRAVVRTPKTIDDIRNGNFKIPSLKKLDPNKTPPHKSTYAASPEPPVDVDADTDVPTANLENTPF